MPEEFVLHEDPQRPGTFVNPKGVRLNRNDYVTSTWSPDKHTMTLTVYREGEEHPDTSVPFGNWVQMREAFAPDPKPVTFTHTFQSDHDISMREGDSFDYDLPDPEEQDERRRLSWFLYDLDWDLGQRADVQDYLKERLDALGGPMTMEEMEQ
jgi:hypothetical protein